MAFQKGRQKTGGRKAGVKYKTFGVDEVQALIRSNGENLTNELLRLAAAAKHEATRLAAINAAMERAYGKPVQPIEGTIVHQYEVTLAFGQSAVEADQGQHAVSDGVSGPAADIKALVHMRSP